MTSASRTSRSATGRSSRSRPRSRGTAREEIDARGLHVLPGVVDVHVHFNEPGRTDWEGWATGSAACAVGGTTTVAEMPLNAHPPTLDGPSFDAKRKAAEASSLVDFALWGGLTPVNLERMEELAGRGVIGFKAFMSNSGIDDFPAADDATLFAGMQRAAALGLPVAVHAENDALTAALAASAIAAGHTGRARLPRLATGDRRDRGDRARHPLRRGDRVCPPRRPRQHRARHRPDRRGSRPRASTSPPRPARTISCSMRTTCERLGAIAKCAPPCDRGARSISSGRPSSAGDIQIVASDHSPAPADMKSGDDFFRIWGGISGCQSLLTSLLSARSYRA